jgi:hypothetical protein
MRVNSIRVNSIWPTVMLSFVPAKANDFFWQSDRQ